MEPNLTPAERAAHRRANWRKADLVQAELARALSRTPQRGSERLGEHERRLGYPSDRSILAWHEVQ